MERTKEIKGITLIALIVTIIILLILAGVAIAILTGENGILSKASNASEETNKQTATEKINLKITNIQIATYTEKQQMPNLQDLANGLCNDAENEIEYVITKGEPLASQLPFVDTKGYNSIFTKLTEYPYEFEIDSDLRLASIDGIKVANTNKDKDYEQVMNKIGDLETKLETLGTENAELKTEVQTLKNETKNKSTKLLSQPVIITLTQTNWEEGNYADIQLTDSIKSYRYLEIQYDYPTKGYPENGGTNELIMLLATEQLNMHNSNEPRTNKEHTFYITQAVSSYSYGIMGWFKNEKLLHIGARWNDHPNILGIRIRNIYGIK